MFAVPGWAISSSSLVREQPRLKKSASSQNNATTDKQSKKRKRKPEFVDAEPAAHHVTNTLVSNSTIPRFEKHVRLNDSRKRPSDGGHGEAQSHHTGIGGTIYKSKIQQHGSSLVEGGKNSRKPFEEIEIIPNDVRFGSRTVDLLQTSTTKLTPLQAKMRSKLTSARFRHLNETLYTTTSSDALNLFTTSPELFADYHAGFAQQVRDLWPQNPVDAYIRTIKTRGAHAEPKQGSLALPRRKTGSCTIADLGCGDAPLARGCQSVIKALKLKFHNYDLHTPNSLVTKADISNLPLRDGEADIAIFCLSLMGTNWIDFVEEAWRVLRGDGKGEVWVAEVKSRFGRVTKGRVVENSVGKRRKNLKTNKTNNDDDENGGREHLAVDERAPPDDEDETDISAFIKVFTRRGFQLREGSVDKRNKMFVSMVFTKSGIPTAGKHKGLKWTGREYQKQQDGKMRFVGGPKADDELSIEQEAKVLKPCVYKIR